MAVKEFGKMIFPVGFKQPVSSLNDEGGKEISYSTAFTMHCGREEYRGDKRTEANSTDIVKALKFYAHWTMQTQLVDKRWLLEFEGQDYTVEDIDKITYYKRFIRFTAKSKE